MPKREGKIGKWHDDVRRRLQSSRLDATERPWDTGDPKDVTMSEATGLEGMDA